jgi:hypothetical protein
MMGPLQWGWNAVAALSIRFIKRAGEGIPSDRRGGRGATEQPAAAVKNG